MASEIVIAPPIVTEVVEGWGVLLPDGTLMRSRNSTLNGPIFGTEEQVRAWLERNPTRPGSLVRLRATVEAVG